jgi:predicted nucleic acid binding AN1-type Zn finger protein
MKTVMLNVIILMNVHAYWTKKSSKKTLRRIQDGGGFRLAFGFRVGNLTSKLRNLQ